RVQFALQVFDGIPGIRTDLTEEDALSADTFGFPPPKRRTADGRDAANGRDGHDGHDGHDGQGGHEGDEGHHGPDVLPVIPAAG
ncbi:MAG TPA: hypothetical protein VK933_15525, partial [Longimicrobiales bacterium]|nr:hypothetical protein [Longimicrobiales bacterium]